MRLPYFIGWIISKIRHYRYVRYLMYGNRESRRRDKDDCKEMKKSKRWIKNRYKCFKTFDVDNSECTEYCNE